MKGIQMKKIFMSIICGVLMGIMASVNVFAMPFNPNQYTSVEINSSLLPEGVKQDKASERAVRRGDFFVGADLIISDEGNGGIGVLAVAYFSVPVEEVYITVYLDRWDEDAESWRQVTYYDAEFYASDYPDGLETPSVSLTFNQAKGYYYRLRGVYAAILNGNFEGFSPVTDGILIK